MSAISGMLRKHAERIKSECGQKPEIYHDLIRAADHIDHMDRYAAQLAAPVGPPLGPMRMEAAT